MTKKNLVTVVTEHKLMADTIAKAIGANEIHDGFYHGNGYAVTWTNGEVIEATFKPDEAFILASEQDPRQMYAHHFSFKMRQYDELVGYKKSKEDAAQLDVIKTLWSKSKTIINAMFPTFEGEIAFLNLYWFLRIPVEVKRAWLPRLRKTAIVKAISYGVRNPEKHEKWLGAELINHFIQIDKNANVEVSESACSDEPIRGGDTVKLDHRVSVKVVSNESKPLHNMLTLWIAATAELGYDFEQTFQIAHRLYMKQLISYPYLLQNSIPESVAREMEQNMKVLVHNTKWGNLAIGLKHLSRRNNFRDGETAFNGHGIVTTGLHPVGLSRDEEKLYNIIVKRVIDAFTPSMKVGNKKTKNSFRKSNNPFKKGG